MLLTQLRTPIPMQTPPIPNISHLLRYIDALEQGTIVSLPYEEEAGALKAAYDASKPGAKAQIVRNGRKWAVSAE